MLKKRKINVPMTEDEHLEALEKIQEEYAKRKWSRKVIGDLMKETFLYRRRWIIQSCPHINDILEKYQPLEQYRYVSSILKLNCSANYIDTTRLSDTFGKRRSNKYFRRLGNI